MSDKKTLLAALIFLTLVPASAVYAAYDEETGDAKDAAVKEWHWYAGASTGYFKPDGARGSGNTRTLGVQGGFEVNHKWAVELDTQQSTAVPGNHDLRMNDLSVIRYWGDDVRLLVEAGYTHSTLDVYDPANLITKSVASFHIGAGISTFITDNLELRGDIRLMRNEVLTYTDGFGRLSLNWHFVEAKAAPVEEESVLGPSDTNESLPPMAYRESEEPVAAPVETVAPVAAAPAAPSVPVPKAIHTLLNFKHNSVDIEAQYHGQLDEISTEIKATNSKAVIEGHTDSVGSAESNKVLSLDRAIVVKRELKKRGVDGKDMQVVGFGEEQPVAPNDTAEGRKQNRRVEVKIYDK